MKGFIVFTVTFFFTLICFSQPIKSVKIAELEKTIAESKTPLIINFWATWCQPCVEELPYFQEEVKKYRKDSLQLLLVSMDFKEDLDKKLVPFLEKNKYSSEVILLDEVNGNDFINKINKKWGGAIPATYFTTKNKKKEELFEKKINLEILNSTMNSFLAK